MELIIIVGSTYFFSRYKDFKPKDKDILSLEDNPKGYKIVRQIHIKGKCIFQWKKVSVNTFISDALSRNIGMELGKFLIPEFCREIGFTIDMLHQLKPLVEVLDDKHKYEKIIFDSYIENKSFTLTKAQRDKAYEEYKKERNSS